MKGVTAEILTVLVLVGVAQAQPASRPASRPEAATRPAGQPLGPGDATRTLQVDGRDRSYIVHVPPGYDRKKLTPVVLNFHGAWTNAGTQVLFSGMNRKADEAGFAVVYPNGTGFGDGALFFNAWAKVAPAGRAVDDVKFVARLLDDLATVLNVDARRVYATGMSNGGMMCHRLAVELSDRIAAVAPVSGTLCMDNIKPARPVPVIHFHGTADTIVPFGGPKNAAARLLNFKSVDDTIKAWVKANGCPETPEVTELPDTAGDGTTVTRKVYGPGRDGAEVVLYAVEGGGHTWPGQNPVIHFLGKYTRNISANDLIWEFFRKHPMPAPAAPANGKPPAPRGDS